MSRPSVSVVIPTRNRADRLPAALRSVLTQSFGDLEVIVVDDASEDETPRVLRELSDPRLRSVRHDTPKGGSAARNTGIRGSRGEYVAFLDDDDEWLPDKLQAQVELLRRGSPKIGMVYSSYCSVERPSGRVVYRKVAERRGDLSRDLLGRNFVGGTSAAMVRRVCLEQAGFFDERLPSFQDYDLWIRLSRFCWFDFGERDLVLYTVHPRRISTDLDALSRGIEIMVEKHGRSREMRRQLGYRSLRVGVQECFAGNCSKGRASLRRAMGLRPLEARSYLNFALSLLGARAFRAVHDAKQGLTAPGVGNREMARESSPDQPVMP